MKNRLLKMMLAVMIVVPIGFAALLMERSAEAAIAVRARRTGVDQQLREVPLHARSERVARRSVARDCRAHARAGQSDR